MPFQRVAVASLLMIAGFFSLQYLNHNENILPRKPFAMFPKRIGDWEGKESRFDSSIYDILGVDDSFLANYMTDEGRYVQLYIGYYQSQRKGSLIHSPRNCMPGAGWKIVHSNYAEIDRGNDSKTKVIKLTLQNGNQKQLMLYWFHSRGRIIASEYLQKIYLIWDSIFRHRTDGSFVRLISPIVNGNDDQALKSLLEFAEKIFPLLNEYVPS